MAFTLEGASTVPDAASSLLLLSTALADLTAFGKRRR